VLRWALASLTALVATASIAQVSGSVSVVSDDRFRGVSLTQGKPAAQLDASYDDPSGVYAGAFASNVKFYEAESWQLQLVGYAGYAYRLARGWSIDGGASYSTFSGDSDYRYLELNTGVTSDALSARLYYSPNYFGGGVHTLYAELNGSYRLSDRFKLIGHAGLLKAYSGATDQVGGTNPHSDLLAGVEYRIRSWSLQVSRVFPDGSNLIYPVSSDHTNGVLTARLSLAF
jgi:uncharacterized protein (TIGR02001 family)